MIQPDSERCKDYDDDYDDYLYYDEKKKDKSVSEKHAEDIDVNDIVIREGNYTPPGSHSGVVVETGVVKKEENLNSDSMKSYDLSPKIYSPYDTSRHPDDQLIEKYQQKTYSTFSSSGSKSPGIICRITCLLILISYIYPLFNVVSTIRIVCMF